MSSLFKQLFWFVVVGSSSALVHWLVVVALVSQTGIAPLLANVAGWLIAFLVSFTGHYQLTFRHHDTEARAAIQRFFGLSACGFLINELSYAFLLKYTQLNYQWLLAAVLVGVAFITFVVSKFWAFAPQRRAQ